MRLLVVLLLLVVSPLRGQDATSRVQADTSIIRVGDRITFTIEVTHATDQQVLWPDSLNLMPFEVLSAVRIPPVSRGEGVVDAVQLVLTAFEVGELQIPSIDLRIESSGGTVADLSTDAWGVEVVSVGLDEGDKIRAIKGPLLIARTVVSILGWLILAVLLVGAGLWWWRRRHRPSVPALGPVQLARPAHEVAYEALRELEKSGLLGRNEIKEYHVRVSEIVRTYVEARYDVFALEMTTADVVDQLWRVGLEGELLDRFRSFLERADLVKFAKARPNATRSSEMVSIARSILDDTQPRVMEFDDDPESSDSGENAVADLGGEEE